MSCAIEKGVKCAGNLCLCWNILPISEAMHDLCQACEAPAVNGLWEKRMVRNSRDVPFWRESAIVPKMPFCQIVNLYVGQRPGWRGCTGMHKVCHGWVYAIGIPLGVFLFI